MTKRIFKHFCYILSLLLTTYGSGVLLILTVSILMLPLEGCGKKQSLEVKTDKSAEIAQSQGESSDQGVQLYFNNGIKNLNTGNYDDAVYNFEKVIEITPDHFDAYYNLGLAYASKKDFQNAVAKWEIAIELKKDYPNLYFNLAKAYKYLNDKDKSIINLEKYLKYHPEDTLAQNDLDTLINKQVIGTGIIGRILISDIMDDKGQVDKHKSKILNDTENIHFMAEVINPAKEVTITLKIVYLKDSTEVIVNTVSTKVLKDSAVVASVTKPENGWPIGIYELHVLVDGVTNVTVPFKIL